MKSKIAKLKAYEPLSVSDLSNLTTLESQRESLRTLRDDWFLKQVQYMQKINDLSQFETQA